MGLGEGRDDKVLFCFFFGHGQKQSEELRVCVQKVELSNADECVQKVSTHAWEFCFVEKRQKYQNLKSVDQPPQLRKNSSEYDGPHCSGSSYSLSTIT